MESLFDNPQRQWKGRTLLVGCVLLIVWIIAMLLYITYPRIQSDSINLYTISMIGCDGKEGQCWEHVEIVERETWGAGSIHFIDQAGHDWRISGPYMRVKESPSKPSP